MIRVSEADLFASAFVVVVVFTVWLMWSWPK